MNLGESLPASIHPLRDHGARDVFDLPGDFALPSFRVAGDSGALSPGETELDS